MTESIKHTCWNAARHLAGACGLFTILALAPAVAQQVDAAHPKAAAVAAAPAMAQPAARQAAEVEKPAADSASQQGIKVHGHWVLQVKNADGTLGERREFDNSLVTVSSSAAQYTGGDQILAGLLSGNISAGSPMIGFQGPNLPGTSYQGIYSSYCANPNDNAANDCFLFGQPDMFMEGTGYAYQTGLISTVNFGPPVQWVLSGNFSVPSGLTSIVTVQTLMQYCISNNVLFMGIAPSQTTSTTRTADISPSACLVLGVSNQIGSGDKYLLATLTSTGLSTPLAVSAGQVVQVTVTITFS